MMRPILLDLDDTLIDDNTSTKIAFAEFVSAHRDRLGDEPTHSLADRWRTTFRQFWSLYEQGRLSFSEQRRLRVRAFFADDLTDAEADDAFIPYLRAYESSWKLLPGVSEFLARTEHIPKVILTNGDRAQQLNKARSTGLLSHVVSVVTPEDCGSWKPKPDMFIAGARILGVPLSTCVMIGDDMVRDIEPARALGMRSFHVEPGVSRRVFNEILSEISPA